jgi:membrane protein DedA with SNARE-associated domain
VVTVRFHPVRRALVVFTTFLFVIGTLGTNIGPALVDERPLLVLTLSSRNRNLLGSIPYVDAPTFFVVGFLRLLVAACALFFVGRWFGHRALEWTESQIGEMPAIYRWTERFTSRFGWVAVFLMPGSNVVCLLVGHLSMPPRRFVSTAVAGIAARLTLLWFGGKQVEDQIQDVVGWINRYQWWIVGALFGVTFFQSARRRSPIAPVEETHTHEHHDNQEK